MDMRNLTFSGYSGGGGGGTPGGGPVGYNPAYGGIPNLPAYTTDTQHTIGTDVQAEMVKNLPGYLGASASDMGNIQSNLWGKVPADVLALMQQQGAERGIATGSPGSPNMNAAYLRALGLTSLQLQQLGHSQLTEAMQRTPIQQQQTSTMTTDLGAQRAIYAAAPVPAAAAAEAQRLAQQGLSQGQRYGGGLGSGGYTLNPAAPKGASFSVPTTAGATSPYYGSAAVGSQVGMRQDYPGYIWNGSSYELDPNYLSKMTGGALTSRGGYSMASADKLSNEDLYGLPASSMGTGGGYYYAGANPQSEDWVDAGGGMMVNVNTGEVQPVE